MKETKIKTKTVDELRSLGFDTIANVVDAKDKLRTKTFIAYNNYEYITQSDLKEFNKDLRQKTEKRSSYETVYDKLVITHLSKYPELPPAEVLADLKVAQDRQCFDYFEIAKIESIVEVIDPILFGRINGCSDMFFVSQWDIDVKFEDIKKTVDSIEDIL